MIYRVTKLFTAGPLKGLQVTETTSVAFKVGQVIRACVGSSRYRVLACEVAL